MKSIFSTLCLLVALQTQLAADGDVTPKKTEEKFVQEYSGYSITLPEGWKLIGDERDEFTIQTVSGMSRYIPGPEKEITSAEWAFLDKPNMHLDIVMLKCLPDRGVGKMMQELKFLITQNLSVEDKGTLLIQDKQAQWWIGKDVNGLGNYVTFIGKGREFYAITFLAEEFTPQVKSKCDEILKTFTFLN